MLESKDNNPKNLLVCTIIHLYSKQKVDISNIACYIYVWLNSALDQTSHK